MAGPTPMHILVTLLLVRFVLFFYFSSETELYLFGSLFFVQPIPEKDFGTCASEAFDLRFKNSALNLVAKKSFNERWIKYLCRFGFLGGDSRSQGSSVRSEIFQGPLDRQKAAVRNISNRLKASNQPDPVFVTAFSENHFLDGLYFLTLFSATLAKENLTNITLYLYDLGLKRSRLDQIRRQFGRLVTVRPFPFHVYPPYVAKLKEYRWKPLIIAEVLQSHDSVWWMDSSVRVFSIRNLTSQYSLCDGANCLQYPLTFQIQTYHSIFATTTEGMYDYFPISKDDAIRTEMMGATVFHLFKTPRVLKEVIVWWVLCALEQDCMAPPGHYQGCDFRVTGGDRETKYAECHRYDQSALNILVATANVYSMDKYSRSDDNIIIDRLQ